MNFYSPTENFVTCASPRCYLCGEEGTVLYSGLPDRLWGAPGVWSFRRCPTASCDLIWLDPLPTRETIGLAYRHYYTHPKHRSPSPPRRDIVHAFYRATLAVTGIRRARARLDRMYLGRENPGKLLEVGCGDGSRLALLRDLGWQVEGQELNEAVAAGASQTAGVPVHCGDLQNIGLAEDSYQSIIMNHVIEHVHDPKGLLAECHRLLATGGIMTVVTPNTHGWSHRHFGVAWRDLDPPRHLHLFSPPTLLCMARETGFPQCEVWTTPARTQFAAEGSYAIQKFGRFTLGEKLSPNIKLSGLLWQFWAQVFHLVSPTSGDECVLRVVK